MDGEGQGRDGKEGGIVTWHPDMPHEYRNAIVTGDALDLLETLPPMSYSCCVADPPYFINTASSGNGKTKINPWGDLINGAFWYSAWYRQIKRVLKQDGCLWTFCNWRTLPAVIKAALDAAWGVTSVLVWDKDWIGPGGPIGLRPRYELVALLSMPQFKIEDRGIPDIVTVPWSSHKPTGHPAEKPLRLYHWLMRISTEEGPIIDPFCGSGTAPSAAKSLGFGFTAFEIDADVANKARDRITNTQGVLL